VRHHRTLALLAGALLCAVSSALGQSEPRTDPETGWTTQDWPQEGQNDSSTRLTTAPFSTGYRREQCTKTDGYPVSWSQYYGMFLGPPVVVHVRAITPAASRPDPVYPAPLHGPYGILFTNYLHDNTHPRMMVGDPTDGTAFRIISGRTTIYAIDLPFQPPSSPVIAMENNGKTCHVFVFPKGESNKYSSFTLEFGETQLSIPGSKAEPNLCGAFAMNFPAITITYYKPTSLTERAIEKKSFVAYNPAISGNALFFANDRRDEKKPAGFLRCIQWATLAEKWKAALQVGEGSTKPIPRGQEPPPSENVYQPCTSPAVRGTLVVVGAIKMKSDKKEDETDSPQESAIFGFSTFDGSLRFTYTLKGKILPSPAILSDCVVFGTNKGQAFAVDFKGQLRWKTTEDGRMRFASKPFNAPNSLSDVGLYGPAVDSAQFYAYFGGSDGRIHRFNVRGGAHLASASFGNYFGWDGNHPQYDASGQLIFKPFTITTPPVINDNSATGPFLAVKFATRNDSSHNASGVGFMSIPSLAITPSTFNTSFKGLLTVSAVHWCSFVPGQTVVTTPRYAAINFPGFFHAAGIDMDCQFGLGYWLEIDQVAYYVGNGFSLDKDEGDTGGVCIADGFIFASSRSGRLIGVPSWNPLVKLGGITAPSTKAPPFVKPPQLGPVRVYPNPFRPDKAVGGVAKFENLPAGSRVEIYTLAHERVQVLEPSSPVVAGYVHPATAVWDGKNESGQNAAAGVYLYIITIPDQPEMRGKLALVRK